MSQFTNQVVWIITFVSGQHVLGVDLTKSMIKSLTTGDSMLLLPVWHDFEHVGD